MSKKKTMWDTSKQREIPMKQNVFKDSKKVKGALFDPAPSKNRLKTYNPINECDY